MPGEQYTLPSGSEAIIGLFAYYSKYNKRLFSDDPWTYTRLMDKKVQSFYMIVGGFAPDGLRLDYNISDCNYYGVAALQKFRSLVLR